MDYRTEVKHWLESDVLTEKQKESIRSVTDCETLELHFGMSMAFGTAGLRSVMDMGPGCMNVFTVAHITQAIAELILSEGGAEKGAAIAYDSRHHSEEFARVAACTLAANGIKVYIFDDIRPTPELSYAIRKLGCMAGINITASHNPKQYNGYKAYWQDGAQISPAQADIVSRTAQNIDMLTGARTADFDAAKEKGDIVILGEDFDTLYLDEIEKTAIDRSSAQKVADRLPIVYTPLHGAGRKLVPAIMRRLGLKKIYTVDSQMSPDGDFPTVKKPNPEYADVFSDGLAIAEQVKADLVIATDPDADRIGVMCRGRDGKFFTVTGNQMGALLLDYVIRARRGNNTLSEHDYAVKSLVSTDLANRICQKNNVKLYDVPTGFKYIGEVIKEHDEKKMPGRFLIGFEESYGYLFGSYARDKDAVGACAMICEMTAWYFSRGMNLSEALENLYREYGLYREGMLDIYMEGLGGIEKRKRIMEDLRRSPLRAIGGVAVSSVADFETGKTLSMSDGSVTDAPFCGIDVLYYTLHNGDKFIIRPSGTEPKIKIYLLCHGDTEEQINEKIKAYEADGSAVCGD